MRSWDPPNSRRDFSSVESSYFAGKVGSLLTYRCRSLILNDALPVLYPMDMGRPSFIERHHGTHYPARPTLTYILECPCPHLRPGRVGFLVVPAPFAVGRPRLSFRPS